MREGQTLGVVGESGSGKTTLGLALLRLISSEGRIVFLGETSRASNSKEMRPLRADMQIVFQDPFDSLSPRMVVSDIVAEGLSVHEPSLPEAERDARVIQALRGGRHRSGKPLPLSARILRRPAAADRDRPRAWC